MTFCGFNAQTIVAMMVRFSKVNTVMFDTCAFNDYQRYLCTIRYPCSRLYLYRCRIDASVRKEFISFFFGRSIFYFHLTDLSGAPDSDSFFATRDELGAAAA